MKSRDIPKTRYRIHDSKNHKIFCENIQLYI